MATIYFIRHGETDWNREGRYQGKRDIPLNDRGREMAAKLQSALAGVAFDVVYSSNLSRAHETAKIALDGRDLHINVTDALQEINHGDWEGKLVSEIETEYPQLLEDWFDTPTTVTFPNGESLHDMALRADTLMQEVVPKYPSGTVGVFTHDAVIRGFLSRLVGAGLIHFHKLRLDPTSVSAIEISPDGTNYRMLFANNVSHLGSYLADAHRAV